VERQKEAVQARRREAEERRIAEARRAAERRSLAAEAAVEDNVRKPWDTGPIFTAARNAAVRTLRSVAGRADRETVSA
jgi:hypothetical protein